MLTRKCQKTPKIDENINIERENLNIFWTTWGTLMKFSGKKWLNIKSHKKTRLHSAWRKSKFRKITNTVKIWSKRTLSEISEFSIFPYTQNLGKICFIWLFMTLLKVVALKYLFVSKNQSVRIITNRKKNDKKRIRAVTSAYSCWRYQTTTINIWNSLCYF